MEDIISLNTITELKDAQVGQIKKLADGAEIYKKAAGEAGDYVKA